MISEAGAIAVRHAAILRNRAEALREEAASLDRQANATLREHGLLIGRHREAFSAFWENRWVFLGWAVFMYLGTVVAGVLLSKGLAAFAIWLNAPS